MRGISATILDSTHLELREPLDASPGDVIQISLSSADEMELRRDVSWDQLYRDFVS